MDAATERLTLSAPTTRRMDAFSYEPSPLRRRLVIVGAVAVIGLLLLTFGWLPGAFSPQSAGAAAAQETAAPLVRVRLLGNTTKMNLAAGASPVLSADVLATPVRLNLPGEPVLVTLSAGGWRLGDQAFPRGELTLDPTDEETASALEVNGTRYRGRVRLVPKGDNTFDVVNHLDVESYLMGVLPKEIPGSWTPAAHEAQAIVARTYAIFELKTTGASRGHWDLWPDDRSQVYGGLSAEHARAREAVDATRGEVVVHDTEKGPRIFKAYFHSTSGGATLGNDAAFNEPPIDALGSVALGDLGKASSRFHWDAFAVTKTELTRRIKLWGEKAGHPTKKMATLDTIEVAERNANDRPTRFELKDVRGNRYSMLPEEMRWSVNTDRGDGKPQLFSAWFRPINNKTNVVFADGRGWGHGVGMCQWSAEAMAKNGQPSRTIVARSYPNTRIVRAY